MGVISILSVYSQKEVLAKQSSYEKLYGIIEVLLDGLIDKREFKSLYSINGDNFLILKSRVRTKLEELLRMRRIHPPEIADWEGRFERSDMFHTRKIFGKTYELYAGGIDSCIWGISKLFDLIVESDIPGEGEILVFYSERKEGLRRIRNKIHLIKHLREAN